MTRLLSLPRGLRLAASAAAALAAVPVPVPGTGSVERSGGGEYGASLSLALRAPSPRRLCWRDSGARPEESFGGGRREVLLALWEGGPTKRVGAGRRLGLRVLEVGGGLGGVDVVVLIFREDRRMGWRNWRWSVGVGFD